MAKDYEVRGFLPAEVRSDGSTIKVSGYAAVFGDEADIGGGFREVILPGAFTEAIARDDVMFLVNHDGLPLARTRSGTLKLTEDSRGLKIDADLDPDDPDVKAIVPKMKRGDLDKMSFAFWAEVQAWDETTTPPLRMISKVRLYDVSIVNNPAYGGTEIGLRSLEQHRRQTISSAALAESLRMKRELATRR